MSAIRGKVGPVSIEFAKAPIGAQGKVSVLLAGKETEVAWCRDAQGIVIETPLRIQGWDIVSEKDDEGRRVFRISERMGPARWTGVRFQSDGEMAALAGDGLQKKKGVRVRAQMPGKILRVVVTEGENVQKGQPLLTMEAMKMENEIRAPISGKVVGLKAVSGQAVESGVELLKIE